MIFEAREIQPYAEPVPPQSLKTGEVYFAVQYLDEECLIPLFVPRVFIGLDLVPGDNGKYYFQEYSSYVSGVRFSTIREEDMAEAIKAYGFPIFESGAEKHTFTYEKALELLLLCSILQKKKRVNS
jgi:hypothetical protein